MTREEDLAWLAGFFEGEGCIHIGRSKSGGYQGAVTLNQRNEECLNRVLSLAESLTLPKPRWCGIGEAFFSPGLQWTGYKGTTFLHAVRPYFRHPDKMTCAEIYCKFYNPEWSYQDRKMRRPGLLAQWQELRLLQKQTKEAFEAKY